MTGSKRMHRCVRFNRIRISDICSYNEFSAVLYRCCQAGAMLVCLRLITLHFGAATYGVIGLILSWIVYLTFLDFGIISVIRTEIPYAFHHKGESYANGIAWGGFMRLIKYTFFLYAIAIVALYATAPLLHRIITFIKLPAAVGTDVFQDLVFLIVLYASALLLSNFVQASLSSRGKQYQIYNAQILGTVVQVLAVSAGIAADWSLTTVFGLLVLSSFIPSIPLVLREISRIAINRDASARLPSHSAQKSFAFFALQVIGGITYNMDTVLVAHFFSFSDVAVYFTMKLVTQFLIALQVNYLNQSWPLYSANRAKGDWKQISVIFRNRMIMMIFMAAITVMALAAFAPSFLSIWSNHTITIGAGFSAVFGVYVGFYMISSCLNVLMYAFSFVELLAWVAPIGLVSSYLIAWHFSYLGPISVVLGNIASLLIGLAVGLHFYFQVFPRLRASLT